MNTISNAAAIPPEVAAWCANYAGFTLTLAKAFLVLALLVALVETALALWTKLQAVRKAPAVAERSLAESAVDPVKLLDALKGVLEALKGLPAWIAIFLAGLALLWIAGQEPKACTPPAARCDQEGAQKCPPVRPTPPPPRDTSNTQGTTNTQ
ncbi:MAG TPA: hypothetical protein VFP12_05685 [Allosphingosinicella sp.]|nr:hypothetical protein [Allosphingosinicella sp.]